MLKTIRVDFLIIDLIYVVEGSIDDELNDNNEVIGVNYRNKTAKSKSQNSVKLFLGKSKLFIENSGSGFLIAKTWLASTKLKKTFIKALILYYFNLKYHIYIKINAFGYMVADCLILLMIFIYFYLQIVLYDCSITISVKK